MILGSHQLKGSVQVLKEPYCLLEKHSGRPPQGSAQVEVDPTILTESLSNTYYKIVGVVRQKFLFNQYPKVIMR